MAELSLIPQVVSTLLSQFAALPALQQVQVDIGAPGTDDTATETVWLADSDQWTFEHRVLSGGQASLARDEEATLPWVIEVRSKVRRIDSFLRAFQLVDEITYHVASDPRLGGGIAGLVTATFGDGRYELEQAGNKPKTKVTLDLNIKGQLRP